MRIKNYLLSFGLYICFLLSIEPVKAQGTTSQNGGGGKEGPGYKMKWSVAPFDHNVFIENRGQFDKKLSEKYPGIKVLYAVQQGPMFAYFTPNGIFYRYDEYPKNEEKADKDHPGIDPDMKEQPKPVIHYLASTWEGANPSVAVEGGEEQQDFYAYETGRNSSVKVNIFKKITYKNIYPNIDIEYIFPKDKGGIKYTVIVHPGGDPSLVKLKYKGAKEMRVDASGNVVIKTGWGDFMDHAPVSSYGEDHESVQSAYNLNKAEESFVLNNLKATETLRIDPWSVNWTNTTPFTTTSSYDGAYDVDYDYLGNVWVYGSWTPLQLVKFNAAGVKQWTFNTTTFNTGYYGDFAIDKFNGTAYCTEGFNGAGAQAEKISTGGVLLGTAPNDPTLEEFWRVVFDPCNRDFPVGAGGFSEVQACILDTSMAAASVPVNVLNATAGQDTHDMALDAPDPSGNFAYMATAHSVAGDPTHFNNFVMQLAQPTLIPTTYDLADGFNFQESSVPTYVGPGGSTANGFNGMAASPNWLYIFDGGTLKQLNKNTGALNASATLSTTLYSWGGLDVDICDNVYAGNNNNIDVYNISLAMTGTIGPLTSTVYDVVLGDGYTTLYTCGKGFVSSIALTPPVPPVIDKVVTGANCACTGKAKATLMLCGNPDTTNVTYLWSNGQTTQTATNLCPGIDSVTITVGCGVFYKDTVKIPGGGAAITVVRDSTAATCAVPGTASVSLSGGVPPYTYLWSTGATTSSINAGAGNYCVTYQDNAGCKDSVCITITGATLPTITIPPDTVCSGSPGTLTANVTGGTPPYTYLWNTGGTSSTVNVSPASTTTYTLTVTDNNGCSNSTTGQVVVNPLPVITISPASDTICVGGSVSLIASGAVHYFWAPSTGLSCTTCPNPTANPTVTTNYTIIGKAADSCTGVTNITVYLAPPPTITLSATATSICTGESVTLLASSTGVTSPYVWLPGPITGPSITVTPTATTTYTVTGSNACNSASETITINVNPLPIPDFSADLLQGCSPLCIQFRDRTTVTSGALSGWSWVFGDGDTSSAENPIYCYPNSGVYTVVLTATSDSGCSSTLKILNMITVYSHPVAAFTMSPQPTDILSPTIQFTDKSTDAYGIVYWAWTFGDYDSISNLQNPVHTYQDTGSYCAREIVMNNHGCTDTTTGCLVIDPIFTIYIPEAFSPNGDGINDVFIVKGNDVKNFEMYIFDRWGMQLFHTTDINNGWDGRVNGGSVLSQEDTYVYLITATDNKNTQHKYIGQISLIK